MSSTLSRRMRRRAEREARRGLQPSAPQTLPEAAPTAADTGDHVAILVPAGDMCHTEFAMSLVKLVARTVSDAPPNFRGVSVLAVGTSILPFSRQLLAVQALEMGATHTLWIDSDMSFPEDMLLRLLAHRRPVIGANCIARRPPYRYTAQANGEELPTLPESAGLAQVDRIGFGVMLVNCEVYRKTPLPWFSFDWMPEQKIYRGEDYVFCNRIREAGYDVWIDHDVSREVKHIGSFAYSPLHKAAMATLAAAGRGMPQEEKDTET